MGFFDSHKNGERRHVIVVDVGSGSVGGALVATSPGARPEILYTVRKGIVFQEKLTFARFFEATKKTLKEVCDELARSTGDKSVAHVYVTLASPWYASQTRVVRYARPEPFRVTEQGVAKLIEHEIALFRESKLFTRSKQNDTQPEIMEAKNIQTKLNGYEVRSASGKRAREVEIALYISMIPGDLFAFIRESVTTRWKGAKPHASSFAFAAFDTVRDMFGDESGFLFMDISGEATDMSLTKDNVLLESISFASGTNTLLRAFIDAEGGAPAAAASELALYFDGKCTKERAEAVSKALSSAKHEWTIFFEDALQQFAKEFPIPRTIFYTTDGAYATFYEDAIREAQFVRFGAEETTFTVRLLGDKFLNNFVTFADPGAHDPFLAIEAIAANKLASLQKS